MDDQVIGLEPTVGAAAGPTKRAVAEAAGGTAFSVLLAISFCHMLNDLMQSLLPAIYPGLKVSLGLSFGQIGLVTLAYQVTASILQPLVGLYADRRPTPLALPGGTLFSLAGLSVLSIAHAYPVLLIGASLLGVGSSVFHLWTPPSAQAGFLRFWSLVGCCHLSGL